MILSSCHDCSLNNDCHYHWHCHCHYMQRIYVYFILSCLALPCLALSWCEWTSITIVIIGMTLYELVLHYHIISYDILCSFILCLLLIWSPFYSIEFDLLYCSVLYFMSMNDLCLSVRLSVCLFICVKNFLFSLL